MAKDSKDTIRGRRFNSFKNALDFSRKVNGSIKDLREFENRKSNFKVKFTKGDANKRKDD